MKQITKAYRISGAHEAIDIDGKGGALLDTIVRLLGSAHGAGPVSVMVVVMGWVEGCLEVLSLAGDEDSAGSDGG